MSLDSVVNISISRTAAAVSRQGFGVALILGPNATFDEDVKTYTDPDDMLDDGFQTTDPEYIAATKLMSQELQPTSFMVGKRAAAVVQVDTVTVSTVADDTDYTVTVDGTAYTTDSGTGATAESIRDALIALINAGDAGDVLTATTSSTDAITMTGDVAGSGFTTAVTANMTLVNTTDNVGIVEDLARVAAENNDWYALITISRTKAEILLAAAWIEARRKIYIACSADADVITSATTDVMTALKAASYARTAYLYSTDQANYPEAAWLGGQLPKTPGSVTYKFKTLAGITVDNLSATAVTNLEAKDANYYTTIGGVGITQNGNMAVGEWIDIIIGIDWIHVNLQADVYDALRSEDKIPFTSAGITAVAGLAHKRLQLAKNPPYNILSVFEVTQPDIADIPSAEKSARTLNGISFTGTVQGAVHAVSITGNLSV